MFCEFVIVIIIRAFIIEVHRYSCEGFKLLWIFASYEIGNIKTIGELSLTTFCWYLAYTVQTGNLW